MMYGNESSNWKHTNDAAAKAAKKNNYLNVCL